MTLRAIRDLVRSRAQGCCEYCQALQADMPIATFHVEHIIARQHGGPSVESNLALSCHHCNLHKGPNLSGIDPDTTLPTQLFNPRLAKWDEHFAMNGAEVIGLTPVGRATVRVLVMNARGRLDLRTAARSPS